MYSGKCRKATAGLSDAKHKRSPWDHVTLLGANLSELRNHPEDLFKMLRPYAVPRVLTQQVQSKDQEAAFLISSSADFIQVVLGTYFHKHYKRIRQNQNKHLWGEKKEREIQVTKPVFSSWNQAR